MNYYKTVSIINALQILKDRHDNFAISKFQNNLLMHERNYYSNYVGISLKI